MTVTAETRRGGRWVTAGLRGRGPNGIRKPWHTPAYTTAATVQVATTAALLSAIAGLGSGAGGTVIEVTADLLGDVTIPSNANAASWTQNILIRPPLGTRKRVTYLDIACQHVTVAGFNWVGGTDALHTSNRWGVQASRSGMWRCVDHNALAQMRYSTPNAIAVSDSFMIDCAKPHWRFSGPSDQVDISGGGAVLSRFLCEGCHIAPNITSVYRTSSWSDGVTTWTNPGQPFEWSGTIPAGSPTVIGTASTTYTFNPPTGALLIDDLDGEGVACSIQFFINGVSWITVALDSPDYRYHLTRSLTQSFTAGDVITAQPTRDINLHAIYGVDSQAGSGVTAVGPDIHGDTFQTLSFSGGSVQGLTWRDTNACGTSSNRAFQFNAGTGAVVWDNVFYGKFSTSASYTHGSASSTRQEFLRDVTFQRNIGLDNTGSLGMMLRCDAQQYDGGISIDASNVARATILPTPKCPDLATIWPDCPYATEIV